MAKQTLFSKTWDAKPVTWIVASALLVIAGIYYFFVRSNTAGFGEDRKATTPELIEAKVLISQPICPNTMTLGQDIADLSIQPGQLVTSPGTITGKIVGGYCFEGVCGIKLVDGAGVVIYDGNFMVSDGWTEKLVDFQTNFSFSDVATESSLGRIVISAANASGLQENERCYEVPVALGVIN